MKIAHAVLMRHDVPGWPDTVINPRVPLGKCYRVDLDSESTATLRNLSHPEWGALDVPAIVDIDDGCPLPVSCLRIDRGDEDGSDAA